MIGSIFYGSGDTRIGAHNPKTPRFASFLISIRDSVLALPSADRDRAAAVERNCSGPARPLTGFIARFQNSPRERTKALGGISGVSRFASHDGHKSMRSLYEHPERADNWSGGNERAQ